MEKDKFGIQVDDPNYNEIRYNIDKYIELQLSKQSLPSKEDREESALKIKLIQTGNELDEFFLKSNIDEEAFRVLFDRNTESLKLLSTSSDEENTILAYGMKTRYWGQMQGKYWCNECCNGDGCDEDCTAKYKGRRKECPHCKGRGWIPEEDVTPIEPKESTPNEQEGKHEFEKYPALSDQMEEYAANGRFSNWQKFTDILNYALEYSSKQNTISTEALAAIEYIRVIAYHDWSKKNMSNEAYVDITEKIQDINKLSHPNNTKVEKQVSEGWIDPKDKLPEDGPIQVLLLSRVEGKEDVVVCAVYYIGLFYQCEYWGNTDPDDYDEICIDIKRVAGWMHLPETPTNKEQPEVE